jgi:glycosyl transferase family 25
MKAFIIYNSVYSASARNAKLGLESFSNFRGWEPEMFDGCHPGILNEYSIKYPLGDGRHRFAEREKLYKSKKSCFYSHYDLWNKCVELNEPIVIVEHDTECCGDFISLDINLDSPLAIDMAIESIMPVSRNYQFRKEEPVFKQNGNGTHPVFYIHPHGRKYLAGNVGYLITPQACNILIEDCVKHGWDQNDILINENKFQLYYQMPSMIKYVTSRELQSSSKGVKYD